MNTAMLDQLQAAEADAHRTVDTTRRLTRGDVSTDDDLAAALLRRLLPKGHPTRACSHIRQGPRPMFVSSARPGVALCPRCANHPLERVRARLHAESTRDCDACRQEADGFYETVMAVGPFILWGHVCSSCREGSHSTIADETK